MNPESLYDILKIKPPATLDEIKGAYRRQAMKWHPDRNLNNRAVAEERFKKIAYAYKVLSDAQLRAEYDAELASQQHSGTGQEQDGAASGPGMSEDDAARMFFEQMLDLAFELSRRGFDEAKIIKMLLALDCPENIVKKVAGLAAKGAQSTSETKEDKNTAKDWHVKYSAQSEYAGFWTRAAATLIDSSLLMALGFLFSLIYLAFPGIHIAYEVALAIVISWLYYAFSESGKMQATYGKRAFGIKVESENGCRLTFIKASARDFGKILSAITIGIGYFIQPFMKKRQTLHDWLADAVVVKSHSNSKHGLVILAASIIAMLIIGLAIDPLISEKKSRLQLKQTMDIINHATVSVTQYMINKESIPTSLVVVGFNPPVPNYVESIGINKSGVIFANFKIWAGDELAGKSIAFIPYVIKGDHIDWVCGSRDIQEDILPNCLTKNFPDGIDKFFVKRQKLKNRDEDEAQTEAAKQQRFDMTVSELEARHPELNPKNPHYSQRLVDDAITRMNVYVGQGLERASALRLAVADMEREAAASR